MTDPDATDRPADGPEPEDDLVVTHHVLPLRRGELRYTARSGRVVLREEEVKKDVFRGWRARAEMSVTAYTLDPPEGGDLTSRPITFVFNGGPGSSSIWLHMGLLGPRRVDVGDVTAPHPPPYRLVDNPETLLAVSDLVFVDPMSTGHTRAVEGQKAKTYHGFAKDVEQVTELIRLWCTREDRWMSPKFILGESYGTVRAVAVAERLQTKHALMLNGIVLVSSVLDFGTQDFGQHRWDESCLNFLPTYAAIAHYHGKVKGRLGRIRQEAETFAAGPYRAALAAGRRLPAKERANVVRTLARLTGLSEKYVEGTDLRIEHWRFCTELLRDRGLTVGRIDGRFTGPARSPIAENMDADPSMDAMNGPFAAALHHYLRGELGNRQDLPYEVYANAITKWSFEEFEGKPIFVADKLERLMRANPHLRVRIEYGYYDLATPYHAAEDMVAHLHLADEAFDRIEHEYFETGHMPYLHEASRRSESASIAAFVARR
ncbi:MAG TPA: peptidase S10 [Nocardioides sp.]|uniref:S10 family peptidase n=1 Tax=Nocardioides sp. TaxID=35761 RepID=UPI002E32D225|nr:peptidase S10 [Nocardioides sp.]HEX3931745.1 peptidase S10 [Nocardioides sp.]